MSKAANVGDTQLSVFNSSVHSLAPKPAGLGLSPVIVQDMAPVQAPPISLVNVYANANPSGCVFSGILWESWTDSYSDWIVFHFEIWEPITLTFWHTLQSVGSDGFGTASLCSTYNDIKVLSLRGWSYRCPGLSVWPCVGASASISSSLAAHLCPFPPQRQPWWHSTKETIKRINVNVQK